MNLEPSQELRKHRAKESVSRKNAVMEVRACLGIQIYIIKIIKKAFCVLFNPSVLQYRISYILYIDDNSSIITMAMDWLLSETARVSM